MKSFRRILVPNEERSKKAPKPDFLVVSYFVCFSYLSTQVVFFFLSHFSLLFLFALLFFTLTVALVILPLFPSPFSSHTISFSFLLSHQQTCPLILLESFLHYSNNNFFVSSIRSSPFFCSFFVFFVFLLSFSTTSFSFVSFS
jgi:hypothetical protein